METTRSAYATVLSTTELLEDILAYLSIEELALVQSVSIAWNNTINSSLKLRQNLFLAGRRAESYLVWKKNENPWGSGVPHCISAIEAMGVVNARPIAALHPIMGRGRRDISFSFEAPFELIDLLLLAPGPWHEMLITQPPCKEAVLTYNVLSLRNEDTSYMAGGEDAVNTTMDEWFKLSRRTTGGEKAVTIKHPGGITIGELFRAFFRSLAAFDADGRTLYVKVNMMVRVDDFVLAEADAVRQAQGKGQQTEAAPALDIDEENDEGIDKAIDEARAKKDAVLGVKLAALATKLGKRNIPTDTYLMVDVIRRFQDEICTTHGGGACGLG